MKIERSKLYLILSICAFLLLIFTMGTTTYSIRLFNIEFDLLWLPTSVMVLILPFYGMAQICIHTDDWNLKYWIGILLNLISMIFCLRYLKIDWLP